MQIFESNSSQTFILNGITLPKNFIVIPTSSNHLAVYNCYDTKHQLVPSTHYNQIEVDGIVYASLSGLTNALTPVIYAKSNITLLSGATFGTLQQVTNLGNTTNDEIILDGGAGIQFTQGGDTLGSIVNGGSQFILNDGGIYGKSWSLDRSNLTDYRNYFLPNTGGTIALTSDLNGFQSQLTSISATTITQTNQIIAISNSINGISGLISSGITNGVTTSAPSEDAVYDALQGKTNSTNLTAGRIPYTQSGNTIIDSSRLTWDNTNSTLGINGNTWNMKFQENLNNYWMTIGNNGFGNGSLAVKNYQGKYLMLLQNPTSSTGQAQLAIGNTSSIPAESQLYVYGGQNGANIDMRGSIVRDECNIDFEGADWEVNPNSIGISYFGASFSSTTATTLSYPKQKMGVIRWGDANKAIIVSNNFTGMTPIMLGINDIEIGQVNDKGFQYKSDFASGNTSNPRWITDKSYVDSKVAQTITNGVTGSSPSQDAVYDALALKATDSNVVHKTGNETIAGEKTFDNAATFNGGFGSLIQNQSSLYFQPYPAGGYGSFEVSSGGDNINLSDAISATLSVKAAEGVHITSSDSDNGTQSNMYVTPYNFSLSTNNAMNNNFSMADDGLLLNCYSSDYATNAGVNLYPTSFSLANSAGGLYSNIFSDAAGTVEIYCVDGSTLANLRVNPFQSKLYNNNAIENQISLADDGVITYSKSFDDVYLSQNILTPNSFEVFNTDNNASTQNRIQFDAGTIYINANNLDTYSTQLQMNSSLFSLTNNDGTGNVTEILSDTPGYLGLYLSDGSNYNQTTLNPNGTTLETNAFEFIYGGGSDANLKIYKEDSFRLTMNDSDGVERIALDGSTGIINSIQLSLFDPVHSAFGHLNSDDLTLQFFDCEENLAFGAGIGGISLFKTGGIIGSLGVNYITANRNYELPNSSGTIALLSDVTSSITQTITNGVTGSTPSSDAVYDALALKANISDPGFTTKITTPLAVLTSYPTSSVAPNIASTNGVGSAGIHFALKSGNSSPVAGLSTANLTSEKLFDFIDKSGKLPVIGFTAPSSATDTGVAGEIRITSGYTYTCIATNTWVRSVAATW